MVVPGPRRSDPRSCTIYFGQRLCQLVDPKHQEGAAGVQVTIRDLNFAYDGGPRGLTSVFQRFHLSIPARSVHALVGPTGCGKSTLLRLVAKIETPMSGSITLSGERTARNDVAMVFQNPNLVPWWNVGRNVGIGVEFDDGRTGLYEKIRTFSLDRVGLRGLAKRMPHTLSRGQQTRASIARAMAYDADVMLLDEPFVHLDAMNKRRLWQEFETRWQLDPRTYVLVTHDIEEAVLLSDRITVLSGSHPTSIVETIDVGILRPRGLERLHEPAFRSAVERVWDALEAA